MNILSKEELKRSVDYLRRNKAPLYNDVFQSLLGKIEDSHIAQDERLHNLVLENDEQLAEIERLKESLTKVKNHLEGVMHPQRFVMLDCPWMHKTLSQTLEETK